MHGPTVLKFGGSSLSNIQKIEEVADLIIRHASNEDIAVVVSAMMGETDRLLSLGRQIANCDLENSEIQQLLTNGENISSALVALAISKRGYKAQSFNAWQANIRYEYEKNQISFDLDWVRSSLDTKIIPIITGYQAIHENRIVTLGRGGSDLTAIALSKELNAPICWIYTDVEGVFNIDPNIYPNAYFFSSLSFDKMYEMAKMGAKVMQDHAAHFAMQYNQPYRVSSTFKPGSGTLVTQQSVKHPPIITKKSKISVVMNSHYLALNSVQQTRQYCGCFKLNQEIFHCYIGKPLRTSSLNGLWSIITVFFDTKQPSQSFLKEVIVRDVQYPLKKSGDSIQFLVQESDANDVVLKVKNIIARANEMNALDAGSVV